MSVDKTSKGRQNSPLFAALRAAKQGFLGAGLFSLAINLLMLTGPLFMLQVYDRVLTSRSVPTLVALFVLVAALYAFLGFFEFVRSRVLSRIGNHVDEALCASAMRAWIFQALSGRTGGIRPLNDLTSLRAFLASQGLPALFDLPWAPIYIAIVFFLHPLLGILTCVGVGIVLILAVSNEFFSAGSLREAASYEAVETRLGEQTARNAEAIVAMGMAGNIIDGWRKVREHGSRQVQIGSEIGQSITSASKAIRLLVQSAILALGAFLALRQEISPGTIIAASIIAGRALAPIDMTIGNWRNIIRARQAYGRLNSILSREDQTPRQIELPAPGGHLKVSGVTKLAPASTIGETSDRRVILDRLDFALQPGDALGVIGPSASGKTTLARLLVGLWLPDRGSIRLDGATLDQWDSDRLGRHIGYLPQSVELMSGSVSQNIARFDPDAADDDIIAAAKMAGVHELILALPDGYATEIGPGKTLLSGGQVQRLALARAVLGKPALVVLDEPNSNLDTTGDDALTDAIRALRQAGSAVIVMAHRPSAIAAVNFILMLENGKQIEFGPKAEILRKFTKVAATA